MREEKFRYLEEHTADVAFEAYGSDLNEAFVNAAKAMFNVMTDISKVNPKEKREIIVRDEDLKGLLKKWLEELLFLFDAEGIIFSEFNVTIKREDDEWVLQGEAYGEPFDPEKHPSHLEVKAVSYHMMEIGERNGEKFVRVILDI
ncbi:MAG: archease [Candidatus Njordarchaeales archaeon]